MTVDQPASSVRLLLPDVETKRLVMPIWNGNRFVFDDGTTPIIRTLTPVNFDAAARQVELDIVVHRGGAASSWAQACQWRDEAAISGTARGYPIDSSAKAYVLAGDETALPAISQIVAGAPAAIPVVAVIEVADGAARVEFASRRNLAVRWVVNPPGAAPGAALLPALLDVDMPSGCKVWAAGEAGAMHRVRRYLTNERGLDRAAFMVHGYWKHGR
jgi:NADPH-dependent ferric siderophore reductase